MAGEEKRSRTVIIVQARMGSTRLPNKVLKEVDDKPLLGYLLERLQRVEKTDGIVVATTNDPLDDEIVEYCNTLEIAVERGSEENVLDRYYETATTVGAEWIVRITADCPLVDPSIIDHVLSFFCSHPDEYDYVSNVLERTYPRGMDVEVFTASALKKAWEEAQSAEDKEHVTHYMVSHPEQFRLANVPNPKKDGSLPRLTVDTVEDFQLISHLLHEIYPKHPEFTLSDIHATLKKHPDWVHMNAHVAQKPISS